MFFFPNSTDNSASTSLSLGQRDFVLSQLSTAPENSLREVPPSWVANRATCAAVDNRGTGKTSSPKAYPVFFAHTSAKNICSEKQPKPTPRSRSSRFVALNTRLTLE